MLDHVFTDAIGALRDALEGARLERLALEERFQADVVLGDLSWETSYGLPGEGDPPRVRCDLTLEWPTWSQTAYRQWTIDGEYGEPPQITVEVVLRLQRLLGSPDPSRVVAALPDPPTIGADGLEATGPTVETIYEQGLDDPDWAIEFSYEGVYELDDAALEDGAVLDEHFGGLGGWISGTLVRLGDLDLVFRPADGATGD
ncbi:MAG: hypothetical protein CL441_06105 [Acidimicrobiaceae bacterium]|nr:hypothetical protein [Acidimicrobiaceae bacterium]